MLQFLKISTLVGVLLSVSAAMSIILAADDLSGINAGLKLYRSLSCYGCHTLKGQGSKEGPSLDGVACRLKRPELEIQLTTPRHRQSNSRMPSFAFLHPQELQKLVDFLQTLE